jgi:hypothetical protein
MIGTWRLKNAIASAVPVPDLDLVDLGECIGSIMSLRSSMRHHSVASPR